jgi:hypothetical protein
VAREEERRRALAEEKSKREEERALVYSPSNIPSYVHVRLTLMI